MFLTFISRFFIVLVCLIVLAILVALYFKKEGDAQFAKYDAYTNAVLSDYEELKPFEIKPEFKSLHPGKFPFMKLFKLVVTSEEGSRLKRVNTIDATMLLFMRMYTFLIRPDYKYNLPVLSVDFIFIGKKRVFVMEIIDPAKIEDQNKQKYYDIMKSRIPDIEGLEKGPERDWYKDYVTDFSIHAKADNSKDDLMFDIYKTYLKAYLDMAKNAEELKPEMREKVKQGLEEYVTTLLSKGGPAVEVFEKMLGKEGQEEYVRTVMFGLE